MGNATVQGTWEPAMASKHINELELEAVSRTLKHFQSWILGKVVLVQSDNATTVSYINRQGGTRSPSLCMAVFRLLKWAIQLNITLRAEFIPGVQNSRADALSRQFASPLEWQLNPAIVQWVFNVLDRPLIDLFATAANAQLPTFCTRFPDPQAYFVDSLRMDWTGMFGYAFPPISLIPLVLQRIERSGATVICIIPRWPRRSWFTQILDMLIEEPLLLPEPPDMLLQRRGQLHHPCPDRLQLMAWKLSGDASKQRAFQQRLLTQSRNQSASLALGNITDCGKYMVIGALNGSWILAQRPFEMY